MNYINSTGPCVNGEVKLVDENQRSPPQLKRKRKKLTGRNNDTSPILSSLVYRLSGCPLVYTPLFVPASIHDTVILLTSDYSVCWLSSRGKLPTLGISHSRSLLLIFPHHLSYTRSNLIGIAFDVSPACITSPNLCRRYNINESRAQWAVTQKTKQKQTNQNKEKPGKQRKQNRCCLHDLNSTECNARCTTRPMSQCCIVTCMQRSIFILEAISLNDTLSGRQ